MILEVIVYCRTLKQSWSHSLRNDLESKRVMRSLRKGQTFTNGPAYEIRDLMFFRFVVLRMRMRSPLFGLRTCGVLAWSFLRVSSTCLRTAMALARLRLCAGSSEPLLVAIPFSDILAQIINYNLWGWRDMKWVPWRRISKSSVNLSSLPLFYITKTDTVQLEKKNDVWFT